jgi:hypothetical protein
LDKICHDFLPDWSTQHDTIHAVSIFEFLSQFESIESHSLVDTVIIKSAGYQSKLLFVEGDTMSPSWKTIIARTLFCLVTVSKIANALSRKYQEGTISQYRFKSFDPSEPINKPSLCDFSSQIKIIVSDLESIIKCGTPKVWPIILTVLCLLSWMSVEFEREEYDLRVLEDLDPRLSDPFSDLIAPLTTLSKMFYIQMGGNHPFQSSWNRNTFLELSQEDSLAAAHFDVLNKSWHIASRSFFVHHLSLPFSEAIC